MQTGTNASLFFFCDYQMYIRTCIVYFLIHYNIVDNFQVDNTITVTVMSQTWENTVKPYIVYPYMCRKYEQILSVDAVYTSIAKTLQS